jgi:hypothetical protein
VAGWRSRHARVIDYAFAVVDIVVIGSVDGVVVVLEPVPIGRYTVKAAARRALDSGAKFQQILKVPALQRQFVDQFVGQRAAQRVGDDINVRLFTADLHHFRNLSRRQLEIDGDVGRYLQPDSATLKSLERRRRGGHVVHARAYFRRRVFSGRVGLELALDAGLRVTDDHAGSGHDRARRIRHAAHKASLIALCGGDHEACDEDNCYKKTGSEGFHVSPNFRNSVDVQCWGNIAVAPRIRG